MSATVDSLLAAEPRLWRAGGHLPTGAPAMATGHALLDAALPEGGWPRAALAELLVAAPGSGELALLLPALRAATRSRAATLIAPPLLPYAPALALGGVTLSRLSVIQARDDRDAAWATEQALRAGSEALVVSWAPVKDARVLRRLALAAAAGGTLGVLVRELTVRWMPSPAVLRLALAPVPGGVEAEVLKCRGTPGARHLEISLYR
jgi:protein ImuA